MRRFLVFCLYGPRCSWGEVAVGEERASLGHPGRSAVLGLVAGALGLRRDQEDDLLALDASLGLAVRVFSPGRPLTDFHTVEMPKARRGVSHPTRRAELIAAHAQDDNPMLSFREYRQDALYLACLWETQAQPPWPLEAIGQALEYPVFAPYLGRKSCPPGLPLAPKLVEAEGVRQALAQERGRTREDELARLISRPPGHLVWEESAGEWDADLRDLKHDRFSRRDRLLSRRRWQYLPRGEARAAWSAPTGQEV